MSEPSSIAETAIAIRNLADRLNLTGNQYIFFKITAGLKGMPLPRDLGNREGRTEITKAIRALEAALIAVACKTRDMSDEHMANIQEVTQHIAYLVAHSTISADFFDKIH
jgi:hypothetical protein